LTDLFTKSIKIILEHQAENGAYVASPSFTNYLFCWLRDGSYIAYAMDQAGQHASAEGFYRWVNQTIARHAYKVDQLEQQLAEQVPPAELSVLHTRFLLNGDEEDPESKWGHFQIDGYGTWLWGLCNHVRMTGNYGLLREFRESINCSIRYLKLTWQLPNYDCWEEHPEYIHPYSLAAVYGGFKEVADLVEAGIYQDCPYPVAEYAAELKSYLMQYAVGDGRFVKHIAPAVGKKTPQPLVAPGVDASLMGFSVPYQVVEPANPLFTRTLAEMQKNLVRADGGVYRYKADTYYGGGEWLLLSAWLGWCYTVTGNIAEAERLLRWVERCADADGNLPEQVTAHPLAAGKYQEWVDAWGKVASPLLWSHAMYIILSVELKNAYS
jgi:GH15 family glucan-1,4-alpha-glucosidase